MTITKTAATAMARRTLSYGHQRHADGATARCPVCTERGKRYDVILYGDHTGRIGHGEMVRQLAQAAVDCAMWDEEHTV